MDEVTVAKKTIDRLPASTDVGDTDSILIIGNDGLAYRIEVQELKTFLEPKAKIKIMFDNTTYPDGIVVVVTKDSEEIFNDTIAETDYVIDGLTRGSYVVSYTDSTSTSQTTTVVVNEIKEYTVIIE